MTSTHQRLTGGCQCGAVRFACESLDHASICHCRMCQKAFGNVFSPMATAHGLVWTRGNPKQFRSSNKAIRGFCGDCGTPMFYQVDGGEVEIAICVLDDPSVAPPLLQVGTDSKIAWCDDLASLPKRSADDLTKRAAFYESIISYQHPDHDTTDWKPRS